MKKDAYTPLLERRAESTSGRKQVRVEAAEVVQAASERARRRELREPGWHPEFGEIASRRRVAKWAAAVAAVPVCALPQPEKDAVRVRRREAVVRAAGYRLVRPARELNRKLVFSGLISGENSFEKIYSKIKNGREERTDSLVSLKLPHSMNVASAGGRRCEKRVLSASSTRTVYASAATSIRTMNGRCSANGISNVRSSAVHVPPCCAFRTTQPAHSTSIDIAALEGAITINEEHTFFDTRIVLEDDLSIAPDAQVNVESVRKQFEG